MKENDPFESPAPKTISEDRLAHFRASRPKLSPNGDSNTLAQDLCRIDSFKAINIKSLLTGQGRGIESVTSDNILVTGTDPRITKLKNECKYCCNYMENQYEHNKCCIHLGFFRLKLQKILHSIPFHCIVALLVLMDVIIVIFELTIETREFSQCGTEEDCINKCVNETKGGNETEHLVCGFVGLVKQCVLPHDVGPNASHILSILTITILSLFLLEIMVKIFAFGFRLFLKLYEVFDMIIVASSLVLTIVHFVLEANEYLVLFELLIILRLWRVVRIITATIAAYSSVKEEKFEEEISKIYSREEQNIRNLLEEYEFARSEIIRMRQILLKLKVNPFPDEYGMTLQEATMLGDTEFH